LSKPNNNKEDIGENTLIETKLEDVIVIMMRHDNDSDIIAITHRLYLPHQVWIREVLGNEWLIVCPEIV